MEAITDIYGLKEGLTTRNNKITNWVYSEPEPTQEELDTIILNYNNKIRYIENRREDYPTIEDQLDMQYKDLVNGTTIWRDLITSIKTRYSKPE